MRFGMNVPIFGEYADPQLLAALAVEAEDSGWDGFWVWDHLQWSGEGDGEPRQPSVDPTVALALIAAATSRVRIGPMVLPLARRRPAKVARELATLDHLSGGRLTVGVGLGGPPGLEFGDFGEETDARVRAAKLDEGLAVLQGLWSGEPFTFTGEHHTVREAQLLPPPLQEHVPIWVGGEWPRRAPFRRAARFDGVHPLMFSVPPDEQPAALAQLVRYVAQHRTGSGPYDVVFGGDTVGDGGAADRALVGRFADAGVTWWMEGISHWRGPLVAMRERIRRGPPGP
ncbi:Flavin-dependent oxidoreductase, luciferase family (includes alkanesulfonate monooxygenase SsuD and methylene tetrahydromethanopterin reductase) [Friedmanniella luteola]|uniref:Flavin-dependent oxidoreductase, luciferase family (Includes alkanesulfonate monooxygenase SsuD and methylene tetrahydromethanopterin reductase) n=1 Tax=Friedmanniella luteola TaxID=546871 RepID=A0A1H1ZJV3_9ACTN|nr:LLM class flavin-dependent oxidoreductase [Friedmanniella luteola]SDT34075.1 Flavin-dependent oxidoreductase, luciferase family (includes alkanesulfonate monooxygenase SsuD and methylene tetrahydromethanopterin reductase) [Friedmanniella luteola]